MHLCGASSKVLVFCIVYVVSTLCFRHDSYHIIEVLFNSDCTADVVCSGYGVSSSAYSQPASQQSGSYAAVGQQQTPQYGPYGNRIQVGLRGDPIANVCWE